MAKRATGTRSRSRVSGDQKERIVDEAIALAEEIGWSRVRLRLVADRLEMPMAELQNHFRDLDAVADAWFRRAWQGMLAPVPEGFAEWPVADRLHRLLMRWFDALAPHRTVTHQMLSGKMYLPHPHHWMPMIFNLSRTIQWLRDAAILDAAGRRRQIEEIGLTAIFLATLAVWRRDGTPDQERTRIFLRRRLAGADRTMAALCRLGPLNRRRAVSTYGSGQAR
jgi:AcrR family transcriptional regulator